jgi:hypothetical protein
MNKEAFKPGIFIRESRTRQIHSALPLPAGRRYAAQRSINKSEVAAKPRSTRAQPAGIKRLRQNHSLTGI